MAETQCQRSLIARNLAIEARTYKEGAAASSAVPRVQMNHILVTGKTGERRFGNATIPGVSNGHSRKDVNFLVATAANATNALRKSMLFRNAASASQTRAVLNCAVSTHTTTLSFGKGASQPLATATATANLCQCWHCDLDLAGTNFING